jgi:ribonucleoside-diphosphate reductase alpha chain
MLEHSATTEVCRDLICQAWHAGLKSLSLYRDGCALYEDAGVVEEEAIEAAPVVFREARASMPSNLSDVAAELARRWVQARRELPQRRNGFTQEAVIGGNRFTLRTGEYEDGSLGELFLDMPGERETYRVLVQQFARAISIALQYGVPLSTFVEAFASGHFVQPAHEQGSEILQEANSVLDYVFSELKQSYLKKETPALEENVIPLARVAS